jgi:hypothetical protein
VEFTLGLAEGKTRGLAYVPGIHVLSRLKSKDVDGRDKPMTGGNVPTVLEPLRRGAKLFGAQSVMSSTASSEGPPGVVDARYQHFSL